MRNNKDAKKNANNGGFSLVEVLLAIIILGLVAAPILQIFVTSAQINLRSKEIMAATDVANTTMEYLTSLKYGDATEGIKSVMTDTNSVERVPGLSYTAGGTQLATSYANLNDFLSALNTSYGTASGKKVYINSIANDAYLGVALNSVEYDNYKFDVIIWFESNNGGSDTFYTYDVLIEVYGTEEAVVEDDEGNRDVVTTHYVEKIVTIDGAVANE